MKRVAVKNQQIYTFIINFISPIYKTGIIHTSVGKVSFEKEKIYENAQELVDTLLRLKPSASKGAYIQSLTLSSTMSPGIKVDPKTLS